MFGRNNQRRPRTPSPHQKQMRFFIGLFVLIIILTTIALILLLNWQQLVAH
jgi:hypothetical protein